MILVALHVLNLLVLVSSSGAHAESLAETLSDDLDVLSQTEDLLKNNGRGKSDKELIEVQSNILEECDHALPDLSGWPDKVKTVCSPRVMEWKQRREREFSLSYPRCKIQLPYLEAGCQGERCGSITLKVTSATKAFEKPDLTSKAVELFFPKNQKKNQ
jgi:hypothetical protein